MEMNTYALAQMLSSQATMGLYLTKAIRQAHFIVTSQVQAAVSVPRLEITQSENKGNQIDVIA